MNTNNNNNLAWVNNVKAICMIFVYISHSEVYASGSFFHVRPLYRLFYVNAFFLISGYLFFKKQLSSPLIDDAYIVYKKGGGKELFQNILFRIIIPTLLFGLLLFFPKLIIRGQGLDWIYFFKDVVLGNWSWFTATLAVSELVLCFLLLFRHKCILFYVIVTSILSILVIFLPSNTNYIWYYQSGIIGTFILALGGLYWKYEGTISSFFNHNYVIVSLLLICMGLLYLSTIRLECSLADLNFSWLGIIIALTLSLLLISISKKINRIGIFDFIGKNSITFYFLSGAFPNVIAVILKSFSKSTTLNVVLCAIISLILAYFATLFVNKYIPFLIDLRKLNKMNKNV